MDVKGRVTQSIKNARMARTAYGKSRDTTDADEAYARAATNTIVHILREEAGQNGAHGFSPGLHEAANFLEENRRRQ